MASKISDVKITVLSCFSPEEVFKNHQLKPSIPARVISLKSARFFILVPLEILPCLITFVHMLGRNLSLVCCDKVKSRLFTMV